MMVAPAFAVSLQVTRYRSGEALACVRLPDKAFALTFIHSVSLTPVEDRYRIEASTRGGFAITQVAERFIAHGQGLPSMRAEPNVKAFKRRDGYFLIVLDRPIDELIVRTDPRFKNRLHYGDQTLELTRWPYEALEITPVRGCP